MVDTDSITTKCRLQRGFNHHGAEYEQTFNAAANLEWAGPVASSMGGRCGGYRFNEDRVSPQQRVLGTR